EPPHRERPVHEPEGPVHTPAPPGRGCRIFPGGRGPGGRGAKVHGHEVIPSPGPGSSGPLQRPPAGLSALPRCSESTPSVHRSGAEPMWILRRINAPSTATGLAWMIAAATLLAAGCSGAAPTEDPVCGDEVIDGNEVCDGQNLGGHTCIDRGF